MNQLPLWSKHRWWAEGLRAAAPPPGNPAQDAVQRWENEGGNPPMGDPPDGNPDKHL